MISRHLEILFKQNILTRDESSGLGKKRYYNLTEATNFEKQLHIFEGVRVEQERSQKDESPEEKRRKLCLLLLFIGNVGAGRLRQKGNAELGTILLRDETGTFKPYESYQLPGFGLSDFLNETNLLMSTQAGAFAYIRFEESELQDLFNSLLEHPPIIKKIDEIDGEIRYGVVDRRLAELIFDCSVIFTVIKAALEGKWKYIRAPDKVEYEWYRYFYGDVETRSYFNKMFEQRRSQTGQLLKQWPRLKEKDVKRVLRKVGEEQFAEGAKSAKQMYDKLLRDHKDVLQKYSWLVERLVEKTSPQFLHSAHS